MEGSDPSSAGSPPESPSAESQSAETQPAETGAESPSAEDPGGRADLASAGKLPPNRMLIYFALALAGGAIDLWTKAAIFRWRGLPGQQDIWWIIEGYFGIETAVNIGAVFGLGAGKGTMFAAFSFLAAGGILIWLFWFKAAHSLWLTWALGLITGGIIGNLYDRLGMWWQPGFPQEWKSGVRDWILFRIEGVPLFDPWPNFNIADSLLVVGACMLLYQSFFPGKEPAS